MVDVDDKRGHCRPHLAWKEVLDVALSLGYKLVAQPTNRRQAFVFRMRRLNPARTFDAAMLAPIRLSGCRFPTSCDVLRVLPALGYR